MSDATDRTPSLHEVLSHLHRRQRMLNVLTGACEGLFIGAIVAAIASFGALLPSVPWIAEGAPLALLAIPLGGLLGGTCGLLRRIDLLRLARAMDRAASSEDRFASAWQLAKHPKQVRARLVLDDALSRVSRIPAKLALPLLAPRRLRWLPLPLVVAAALLWLAPDARLQATPPPPEITAEQWAQLSESLRQELEEMPDPRTAEEQELLERLRDLAEMLEKNPQKKDALAEIARLRDRVEQQRQNLASPDLSMRQAARVMNSSQALQQFSSALRQGEYRKAASELKSLAERLREDRMKLTASEYEAMASDLEQLSMELASDEQMQQASQQAADAAASMNREKLAEALKRFAEQLEKNADQLRQCDNLSRAREMLEQLRRQLNERKQCEGCSNGQCSACQAGQCPGCASCSGQGNGLVQQPGSGGGKGGLKPGWASMKDWSGGALSRQDEDRLPSVDPTQETAGTSTTFTIVSGDEDAQSALSYEELYAELVQKAEADLELESVPVAAREYLRRYFDSIRPESSDQTNPEE